MKMKVSILILLFCSLSISCFAQKKSKKELKAERQEAKQKQVDSLMNSKIFVFEAQKLTPLGGRLIILDHATYYLKFNPAKTTCDLPFFGRGYNLPYGGGDGGIKFEGVPEKITVQKKQRNYLVKATVKGKDDVYDLIFNVFFDGGATLSITSNNRGAISYDGLIEAPRAEVRID
jgi:hypothetical protein